MDGEQCLRILIESFKTLNCWSERSCERNVICFDGTDDPLPPYVPLVGEEYFSERNKPRILMYAMNQNLAGSPCTVKKYTRSWMNGKKDAVLDRLNSPDGIDIGPYPLMNLLARMMILLITGKTIQDKEATTKTCCTNLIKCSTTSGPSIPNPIMYQNCVHNTCLQEIALLQPDIVLAMGQEVFRALAHAFACPERNDFPAYASPMTVEAKSHVPKLIVSVYHATGSSKRFFKALQNHFEINGKRPRAFRPFLRMLTGEDYDGTDAYWGRAAEVYQETKALLTDRFGEFFRESCWYGRHEDYYCYFACHFCFLRTVLSPMAHELGGLP